MTEQERIEKDAKAIRWIVIGTIVSEYGAMQLSEVRGELKMKTNAVIRDSKALQNYFRFHPQSNEERRKIFEKEFLKSEIVLLGELLETCWGLSEEDLETIIAGVRKNIVTF